MVWLILLAICCGVIFSFLFALMVVSIQLYRSNDSGNSKASFAEFSQRIPLTIVEVKDGVTLPPNVSSY